MAIPPGTDGHLNSKWEGTNGFAYSSATSAADGAVYCCTSAATRGTAPDTSTSYRYGVHAYSVGANTAIVRLKNGSTTVAVWPIPTAAGTMAIVPIIDKIDLSAGDFMNVEQWGTGATSGYYSLHWCEVV